jgi:hypothetical protein
MKRGIMMRYLKLALSVAFEHSPHGLLGARTNELHGEQRDVSERMNNQIRNTQKIQTTT